MEGMRMRHFKDNVDHEEKMFYTIDERPKRENEDYNYNKYLLIHQHLIKILKLRCYQNGAKFPQTKTIKLFGEKYLYFPLKKNFKFQTIVNKGNSTLKPGLVQVKSNIISDAVSGNSYSTIMFTTALPNQMEGHYFYYNVKKVRYDQLRQTNIETIDTQFTDSFGNLLSLNEGQPSLLHFHLKEKDKNMDHELRHVQIDSKVDAKLDYENSNSSFWVHMKHPLHLNQNAKIALMDISFPDSICSIPDSIGKHLIIINALKNQDETEEHILEIPKLYFCDSNNLTMSMNRLLSEELMKVLYFDNFNGFFRVVAKTEKPFSISIPESFCPILGMYDYPVKEFKRIEQRDNYTMFAVKKDSLFEGPHPINIYKLYPDVMICYANFVQHSIIGDKLYLIYRIIPAIGQSKQNDYCSNHCEHLEFIRCNVDYLDSMNIELRRLDGDLIKFDDDPRVVLNIVIKNPIEIIFQ